MSTPAGPPEFAAPVAPADRRKWWTLGAVSLGMFMVMLDVTVVNVALPSIQRSLQGQLSDLEWVVNGYALALAVGLLTGGRLGDLFGRRLLFAIGLAIFTASSLLAGLSGSNLLLIVARLVQGMGAALVVPNSLSIISATFPPKERGTAIGIWSSVVGLGIAIGPLIGGLLAEGINWNAIFFVNVPIGALAVLAALRFIDESKDGSPNRRIDIPGLLAAAVGLGALTYAFVEANRYGWGSTRIAGLLVVAAVALIGFVVLEARQRLPMLDLSLFRNRTFSGSVATSGIMGFAMTGVFFFLSLFMQNVAHFSPIGAGAAFLPMTMLMMVIPPIAGMLTDRFGPRWLIVGGLSLFTVGLVVFSRLGAGDRFWQLLPGMILAGVGISLLFGPVTAAALSGVPMFKAGVASGVLNAVRQTGSSLGVAVMGAVVAHAAVRAVAERKTGLQGFVSGFQTAMVVAACVAAAGAIVAAVTVRTVKGAGFPGPGGPPGPAPPDGAWPPGAQAGPAGGPAPPAAAGDPPHSAPVPASGGAGARPARSSRSTL